MNNKFTYTFLGNQYVLEIYACLDTNNLPGIYEALMEAGLIYETGFTIKSGFNTYPVALFNVDELPELEVQN